MTTWKSSEIRNVRSRRERERRTGASSQTLRELARVMHYFRRATGQDQHYLSVRKLLQVQRHSLLAAHANAILSTLGRSIPGCDDRNRSSHNICTLPSRAGALQHRLDADRPQAPFATLGISLLLVLESLRFRAFHRRRYTCFERFWVVQPDHLGRFARALVVGHSRRRIVTLDEFLRAHE